MLPLESRCWRPRDRVEVPLPCLWEKTKRGNKRGGCSAEGLMAVRGAWRTQIRAMRRATGVDMEGEADQDVKLFPTPIVLQKITILSSSRYYSPDTVRFIDACFVRKTALHRTIHCFDEEPPFTAPLHPGLPWGLGVGQGIDANNNPGHRS